ncbi:hypothetical protein BgiBS90_004247, partial [Biomphalaria glabrata]
CCNSRLVAANHFYTSRKDGPLLLVRVQKTKELLFPAMPHDYRSLKIPGLEVGDVSYDWWAELIEELIHM